MPNKKGKQSPTPSSPFKSGGKRPKPKKKKKKGKYGGDIPARKEVPGNPHGVTKKDQEGNIILMAKDGGSASKFPDLSGDGKVTQKDILMGRGVIKKKRGGAVDSPKKKKKKKKGFLSIAIEMIRPKTIQAAKGGLAGRLAKRGYGKAKK
jgi:hypothetical protein